MMIPLYESLLQYRNRISMQMHMPGHKGLSSIYEDLGVSQDCLAIDLTEVDGVDSLFHPTEAIKKAQELASKLYKSKETFFLVNGASAGLMAAILSIVKENDEIVLPRNAHRSIMNGIILSGAKPLYVLPAIDSKTGIALGIDPREIENILVNNPKVKAIVVSNPNFYGFCSDIAEICRIAHKYDKLVIVDEACGSHFSFHDQLPMSGIDAGADIVVHGTHKNLPAMTQSGMLHINSEKVDRGKIIENLMLLNSSSPSYVLLASLDIAREYMGLHGQKRLNELYIDLCKFEQEINSIEGVCCLGKALTHKYNVESYDFSKIIVNFQGLDISGYTVEEKLSTNYGIQCELADEKNIMLTFSVADSTETVNYIIASIKKIASECKRINEANVLPAVTWRIPEAVLTPRKVKDSPWKEVELVCSLGHVCAETISIFPPGVPIIRPGERIDEVVIMLMNQLNPREKIRILNEGIFV